MAGGHTTSPAASAGCFKRASSSLQQVGLLQDPAEKHQHTKVHMDKSVGKYKIQVKPLCVMNCRLRDPEGQKMGKSNKQGLSLKCCILEEIFLT